MQHLASVTSPSLEPCFWCGKFTSREWAFVDITLPEFIQSTAFDGFKFKYVFKNDKRGVGYYFDYMYFNGQRVERKWFGRGADHNKCREPLARALIKNHPICTLMNMGEACNYAAKYCIVRESHKQPCKRTAGEEMSSAPNKKPKQEDDILKLILYAANHNVSDDILNTITSKVTVLTTRSAPKTRNEIIEFLRDYYNWERHTQHPVLTKLYWKHTPESSSLNCAEINVAKCISSFSTTIV